MTRKRAAFVIPSLALAGAWVPALMMAAFAYDQPSVSGRAEFLRSVLATTLNVFPIIWILTAGLLFLELKRKQQQVALTVSATLAYAVCLAHALAWVLIFSS